MMKDMGYESSSTDSFRSDSDFDDIIDEPEIKDGDKNESNSEFMPEHGFKKKNLAAHMAKRYERKAK